MTKKTYTSSSGNVWSWDESKELKEYIKNYGNPNRGEQNPTTKVKKSK